MNIKFNFRDIATVLLLILFGVIIFNGCGKNENQNKIIYDFSKEFSQAQLTGQIETGQNPWKKSITVIPIPYSNDSVGIFCAPLSKIKYLVQLSDNKNLFLTGSVEFYPVAKKWNISDGVRMIIMVINGNDSTIVFNNYLMPTDSAKAINIPLSEYSGKQLIFKFISQNDPGKNANGDWPVWKKLMIINK